MTYKTINNLYSNTSWLRVFTDGSGTVDCVNNAGTGVFCEIFSFYSPVGALMSAFDGEIKEYLRYSLIL